VPAAAAKKRARVTARVTRPPLDRQQVFEVALEIIDAEGPTGVTMRRIADEFGVVPTAVHWHVKTREELLRGVVDLVYEGVDLPEAGSGSWEKQARELCRAVRRQFVAHPNVMVLLPLASRSISARVYAAQVMIMRRSGLQGRAVAEAAQLIGAHTVGWVFAETLHDGANQPDRFMAELVGEWVRAHGDTDFEPVPHANLAFDGEARFEESLDYLLDGIRRRAERAASA
jgi:AcrR family transcriptional regulator